MQILLLFFLFSFASFVVYIRSGHAAVVGYSDREMRACLYSGWAAGISREREREKDISSQKADTGLTAWDSLSWSCFEMFFSLVRSGFFLLSVRPCVRGFPSNGVWGPDCPLRSSDYFHFCTESRIKT